MLLQQMLNLKVCLLCILPKCLQWTGAIMCYNMPAETVVIWMYAFDRRLSKVTEVFVNVILISTARDVLITDSQLTRSRCSHRRMWHVALVRSCLKIPSNVWWYYYATFRIHKLRNISFGRCACLMCPSSSTEANHQHSRFWMGY